MSAETRDAASSDLEALETYVKRLEQEWKSADGVLTQLKHQYDQLPEEDADGHEKISSECLFVMSGGAI